MSAFLKAACEACGGHIEHPVEMAGKKVSCPHCHEPVTLPLSIPKTGSWMAQRSKAILRSAGRIALWTLVISTLIGVGLGIGRLLVQINRNPKVLGDILGDVLGGVMGMVVVVLIVMWAFLWLLFPVFVYVRLGRLIELQERVVRALERKP